MLNIHDLERRWLRYKIKSYIPLFTAIIAFIAISSVVLKSVLSSDIETEKIALTQKEILKEQPNTENTKQSVILNIPENTSTQTVSKKTLMLKPSLRFMDNIEEGLDPYIEEEDSNNLQIDEKPVKKTNEYRQDYVLEAPVSKAQNSLTITTKKSESDLKDVIRRFKKNKNPALSLFIAKRYYELGQYQKSYNYALMTNEIDKSIDDSWILFSKSLVKLGQHKLAIVTLKSYLKTNKSSQAEILLRKIEAGSFR